MSPASFIVRFARTTKVALILCFIIANDARAQQSVESDISLTRSESVRITNIDQWLVGIYAPNSTINTLQFDWDWQCVYSSTGTYRVEVTSANGGSRLALASDNGDQMDYQIFSYSRRGAFYTLFGHTDPVFTLTGRSASQNLDCNDEPSNTNLWFTPVVRPAAFNAAPPGIYRDVVTLVVSPE